MAGDGAKPFPWDAVIHAGLCLLRLSASDFWALTPREFAVMTGAMRPRLAGMERAGLEGLMRMFPDGAASRRAAVTGTDDPAVQLRWNGAAARNRGWDDGTG